MSVNGAASGRSNKTNFCDFDGLKKKELERRKKLRLQQVRTQSKELSMKIRGRVAQEKDRQLRNVEEIKRKELLSWKEKHVNNTMADYYYCLSNVGDAHVAAERENELTEQKDEEKRENRKIAALRGRKALERERLNNLKKDKRLVNRKPKTNIIRKNSPNKSPNTPTALKEDDKLLSDDDENELCDSDDDPTTENVYPTDDSTLKSTDKILKQKDSVRFSKVTDLIEERRRARSLCDQILGGGLCTSEQETMSKSPEQCKKSPQPKPFYAPKSPQTEALYGPNSTQTKPLFAPKPTQFKHLHASKSPQSKPIHAPNPPQAKPLYVPKSPVRSAKSPVQKSPVNVRGAFIPKSNKFFRGAKPTAGGQAINSHQGANTKKVITPNKVGKAKTTVASSKFVSPQRREFVPRFTKNPVTKPGILKNKTAPETTTAVTTESTEKVQFYDHFSRYGKGYDALPGMVIRESQTATINANEAARVQNEMDEIRFQQLDELRRKSEQRSKESLQKNQIRKDYENLTKDLDQLCKEESRLRTVAMPAEQFSEDRISQLARNRQQNMNRVFEDIYHKPVVITCPPVFDCNQNSSSSDVNVAASPCPEKQQPNTDPFDSSDSCTSILLGYVDNRSRKLVKDIKQCKNDADSDKRKKLVTLLTRLDHLRKLLMEEIVRNSSLNLEPFYRSVLEVETEKKEILHDPDANKENGDMEKRSEQLEHRERIVKAQEMKLEKKLKEMFRKERTKVAEPRHENNTFESVTSETMTSAGDHSEPLKILIEVKNGGKVRKSRQPKKVNAHVVGAEYQHKASVGSSASTAYRSPPPTFHTEFTKILSKKASEATKVSAKPTKTTKSVQQTPLAQYITRLLGMSQQSVDQLGVSTGSSIATPSDSVIDVAENMTAAVIDSNHLNKVQAKINDSLRFAKEVDDSIKQQAKNQAEAGTVAKKVRDVTEHESKLVKERQMQTKKRQPKNLHSDVTSKSPRKVDEENDSKNSAET